MSVETQEAVQLSCGEENHVFFNHLLPEEC